MRIPVDTEFPRGMNPASVAATALQIAGTLLESLANQATATAGATPAMNFFGGIVNFGQQSVAPGATLTLSVPNNLITAAYLNAGGQMEIGLYSGNQTGGGPNTGGTPSPDAMFAAMALQSLVVTPGGFVATWMNNGQTPLNGAMQAVWHL